MSLMNSDALGVAVREAARVLGPRGRYCAAIVHPLNTAGAFTSHQDDAPFVIEGSYFERTQKEVPVERDGLRMTFLDAHRPREDYFQAPQAAGLLGEHLREITDTSDS